VRRVPVDRVIVSSDLSPQFLNFWPLAAASWTQTFGITPTLALVSRSEVSVEILEKLKQFGEVIVVISNIQAPLPNQAKLVRWYTACKFKNETVTIEDIDTVFLNSSYLINKLKHFDPERLLGIGADVNQDDPDYRGKFPASNLTGRGNVFSEFFESSSEESFDDFVNRYKNLTVIDDREDPFNNPKNFSDESLIRAIRRKSGQDLIFTIPRGVDIQREWMDRSWWPSDGKIPKNAILANIPRPLYNNQTICQEIIDLYFPKKYPWIIKRKSRIWENPDNKIRQSIRKMQFRIKYNFRKLRFPIGQ
jgi:hypothetical protein